jgi:cysteinyl-tRNA synthetase
MNDPIKTSLISGTPIRLFNTMQREIVELNPVSPGEVTLYCCGPTVYNYQHIGNLRTYIFEDLLSRMLRSTGLKVTHVMNITDVGHLVSDGDEGEDKMLLAQKREGKRSHEIAEYYTKVFFDDCAALLIKKPDIVCKATEHISQMIRLIERLVERGFAYQSNGNVYFDVSKNEEYGKLSGQSLDSLKAGARIDVDSSKKNPLDFALWFTKSKFENQELQWDSPWGRGYPGWHIECSAMAMEYLGETFDIHCGGIDHIPVHHTNEIAQSECATGKTFASIWMHGGFLVESGGKMSKSKGDFLTLSRLIDEGFDPLSYRYLCVSAHYRSELSWSWESLKGAENALNRLRTRCQSIYTTETTETISNKAISHQDRFFQSLYHDLNIPQCLARMYDLLSDKDVSSLDKSYLLRNYDTILGLGIIPHLEANEIIPENILLLAKERDQARTAKNFTRSDELRDAITKAGYTIKDTPQGGIVSRK